MAHSPRFRGNGRRSTAKRLSTWFFFTGTTTTLTAAGGTIIYTLNAAALALRPFTFVRSYFELQIISDQAAAVESQGGAFGLAIVSDQAAAAGVASVPTPVTEAGSDLWFVHKWYHGDESKLTDKTTSATRISIDSKAMRKVDVGQDLVVVAEMDTVLGGGQIVSVAGRMLAKVN